MNPLATIAYDIGHHVWLADLGLDVVVNMEAAQRKTALLWLLLRRLK